MGKNLRRAIPFLFGLLVIIGLFFLRRRSGERDIAPVSISKPTVTFEVAHPGKPGVSLQVVAQGVDTSDPIIDQVPCVEIRGRVLTEEGIPIKGASVSFKQDRAERTFKTGEAGDYSAQGFRRDNVKIHAWAPDFELTSLQANLAATVLFDITLKRRDEVLLKGHVLDSSRAPIKGATVSAAGTAFVLTSEDGVFELRIPRLMVKDNTAFMVKAQKSGFADAEITALSLPALDLVMTLYRAGKLSVSFAGDPPRKGEMKIQLLRPFIPIDDARLEEYSAELTLVIKQKDAEGTLELLPGLYQLVVNQGETNERKFFAEVQEEKATVVKIGE